MVDTASKNPADVCLAAGRARLGPSARSHALAGLASRVDRLVPSEALRMSSGTGRETLPKLPYSGLRVVRIPVARLQEWLARASSMARA